MKTIVCTGSSGFLGYNLKELLKLETGYNFLYPSSKELNLLDSNNTRDYFRQNGIDGIIHLAAICGGIGMNKARPADLTHLNNKMTVNIFDAIRDNNIKYFIGMGTVCSYPKYCPVPFKESDLFNGAEEESNRGYAQSKKMLLTEFQTHMEQYGLEGTILLPTNMFGIKDHFSLNDSHVIPALIRKFIDGKNEVKVWGTGMATRDFVFARDVAEAIVWILGNNFSNYEPINLGSGSDISIRDLSFKIRDLVGYKGEVVFTGEVSDGQPKRLLDVTRAKELLGWEAKTNFDDGLKETIKYYIENKSEILKDLGE